MKKMILVVLSLSIKALALAQHLPGHIYIYSAQTTTETDLGKPGYSVAGLGDQSVHFYFTGRNVSHVSIPMALLQKNNVDPVQFVRSLKLDPVNLICDSNDVGTSIICRDAAMIYE